MKLTIYLYGLGKDSFGPGEPGRFGETLEVDVQPHPSAFYGTGRPTRKVDNITIRFIRTDISDVSPASIEGTRQAFEELVAELQRAIDTNKRWAGVKWEDIPDKASDLENVKWSIGGYLGDKTSKFDVVGFLRSLSDEDLHELLKVTPSIADPLGQELIKKASEPVEEIVMTTDEDYEQIEEIRGSCPKCGGSLEFREHIEFFNKEANRRDPYCPSCKLFWVGQEASA